MASGSPLKGGRAADFLADVLQLECLTWLKLIMIGVPPWGNTVGPGVLCIHE